MFRFYSQQVAGTIVIIGCWLLVMVLLTKDTSARTMIVSTTSDTPVSRTKYEPRDERSGEVCRVHTFDELDNRTQVEIKFIDKARAIVYFNQLGRRIKAEEFAPDGSKQVFTFAGDGRNLRKIQSYRADGSLKSETAPASKDAIRVTRFGPDGKTRVSEQLQTNGAVTTTIFDEDGKTPKMSHRQTGFYSELTVFQNGKKRSVDTINRTQSFGGYMMMGMVPVTRLQVESTVYHDDGTVNFKQSWSLINGHRQLDALEVMHKKGGVKLRFNKTRIAPTSGAFVIRPAGSPYERLTVETFDERGTRVSIKTLRADLTVESEVVYDGKEPRTVQPAAGEKGLDEQLTAPSPGCSIDNMLNQVAPPMESHHLKQILTD